MRTFEFVIGGRIGIDHSAARTLAVVVLNAVNRQLPPQKRIAEGHLKIRRRSSSARTWTASFPLPQGVGAKVAAYAANEYLPELNPLPPRVRRTAAETMADVAERATEAGNDRVGLRHPSQRQRHDRPTRIADVVRLAWAEGARTFDEIRPYVVRALLMPTPGSIRKAIAEMEAGQ